MTATDKRVAEGLQQQGMEVRSYAGLLMREPQEVKVDMTGRWVGHFGTLSPFMRCALDRSILLESSYSPALAVSL